MNSSELPSFGDSERPYSFLHETFRKKHELMRVAQLARELTLSNADEFSVGRPQDRNLSKIYAETACSVIFAEGVMPFRLSVVLEKQQDWSRVKGVNIRQEESPEMHDADLAYRLEIAQGAETNAAFNKLTTVEITAEKTFEQSEAEVRVSKALLSFFDTDASGAHIRYMDTFHETTIAASSAILILESTRDFRRPPDRGERDTLSLADFRKWAEGL